MALNQLSDFLENELLDHMFGGSAYSAPSSVWVALFTSNTGLESNTQSNEVSGTNYARLEVGAATGRDFTVAASASSENNEDWQFANPGSGGWGTVVAIAVCSASTSGEILMYSDLSVNRTINQDNDVIFSAGEIKFFFDENPRQISDFLANELLDHVLRDDAYTAPGTIYGGLWTADDGLVSNTKTSEVGSGVGYARQSVSYGTAASGEISNDAATTWGPNTTTNWGTVNYLAALDAVTVGNVLMFAALDSSPAVVINDSVRILTGAFDMLLR